MIHIGACIALVIAALLIGFSIGAAVGRSYCEDGDTT